MEEKEMYKKYRRRAMPTVWSDRGDIFRINLARLVPVVARGI